MDPLINFMALKIFFIVEVKFSVQLSLALLLKFIDMSMKRSQSILEVMKLGYSSLKSYSF